MKKLFCMLIVALLTPLLSGCPGSKGSSAPPPSNITATAGDGRVTLKWTPSSDDYWLFTATDPSLTASNWTGLANGHAYTNVATPFYMCGLFNGALSNWTLSPMPYYFAMNGRTNGGPGGTSSPTISATPYIASTHWAANTTPLSQIDYSTTPPSVSSPNIFGVGYASLTTCGNNATSATGVFAAVGAGGAIFTSPDGQSWTASAPPTSFSTDLYAVTGYTPTQNATYPSFRWVAVGAGGASIYSIDGLGWNIGVPYQSPSNPANPNNYALHSITQAGGTFIAVGDAGTIISTTDGITWTALTSGITTNLNGVARGTNYVAVGDGGKILTSASAGSNTWTLQTSVTPATTSNLRQVASIGNLIVAVGDSGTIVTSKDGGATWFTQNLPGSPNLVGVVAEPQLVDNDVIDGWLGVVPSVQFVAVDSSGNAYTTMSSLTSANGLTWSSSAISTGITSNLSNLGQPLVSSGFGYVAAGNTGATAYAF